MSLWIIATCVIVAWFVVGTAVALVLGRIFRARDLEAFGPTLSTPPGSTPEMPVTDVVAHTRDAVAPLGIA